MPEARRGPHGIQAELGTVEEYQAPPREHEQDVAGGQPSAEAADPVDVSLLEAQEGRGTAEMSETRPRADPDPRSTVSTKDELSDPADPQATPPGERM